MESISPAGSEALKEMGEGKMNCLYVKFYDLICDENGQDLVEYALLITLVALAAVVGINGVASAINNVFNNLSNTLS
jgi:pilus assembly protein Flp/PilA